MIKTLKKTEFGDWQTPFSLAKQICEIISKKITPSIVFEPNCGKGAFIHACLDVFPEIDELIGLEFNSEYASETQRVVGKNAEIIHGDFFTHKWEKRFENISQPFLVIGNPPWVTNSSLMKINSQNLPMKTNFATNKGIEAITGKSNFDISEWMLLKEMEFLQCKDEAVLSMLCKTTVARKVLINAWKKGLKFSSAEVREIDAQCHFNVSVDACLFIVEFSAKTDRVDVPCAVFSSLESKTAKYSLGKRFNRIVSDTEVLDRYSNLITNKQSDFVWRSGIKHDCVKVMEFKIQENGELINGFGDKIDIESDLLYPMLKSSDVANGKVEMVRKMMLVPQKKVGDDTFCIKYMYPKTWSYLQQHATSLKARGSSIYKKRPQFSIFGIGDYAFTPWKVAISGLYKTLKFKIVGPHKGRAIVFDDTCYFLACKSEKEAILIKSIMESKACSEILNACIFWDSKRPVTKDVLKIIDIIAFSKYLEMGDELEDIRGDTNFNGQKMLF